MTKFEIQNRDLGAALLGLYAGIKCAEKAGHDPKMLYELVVEHIREEEKRGHRRSD